MNIKINTGKLFEKELKFFNKIGKNNNIHKQYLSKDKTKSINQWIGKSNSYYTIVFDTNTGKEIKSIKKFVGEDYDGVNFVSTTVKNELTQKEITKFQIEPNFILHTDSDCDPVSGKLRKQDVRFLIGEGNKVMSYKYNEDHFGPFPFVLNRQSILDLKDKVIAFCKSGK